MIARPARSLGPSATTASAAMFASARSASGSSSSRRSAWRHVDVDAVVGGVPLGRLDGLRVVVEREHRREAELCRRDREHARAAADVEHAASLLRLEQLEAELRGRVPAGAEGAARIDHDRDRVAVGLLPRRPDPEPADADRLVELPPAVLPVLLDVGRRRTAERLPDPLLAGRVRVGRDLEAAVAGDLLEPFREELEHDRPRFLGPGVGDGDRDAPEQGGQRIAFLSFSKKPSSRR